MPVVILRGIVIEGELGSQLVHGKILDGAKVKVS